LAAERERAIAAADNSATTDSATAARTEGTRS